MRKALVVGGANGIGLSIAVSFASREDYDTVYIVDRALPADEMMRSFACEAAERVNPGHNRVGRVASGDQFICSAAQKEKIIAETAAICAEMEGAAIAHTAYRNGVPFVVIRAISDKADDSAQMDYPTFEALAAQRCAQVVMYLAEVLAK